MSSVIVTRLATIAVHIERDTRGRRRNKYARVCYVPWKHIEALRKAVAELEATLADAAVVDAEVPSDE